MEIFVDIDKTICHTEGNKYQESIPLPSSIEKINSLFDKGHRIVYWTARGQSSGVDYRDLTEKQLLDWGCKYHKLRMDKPGFALIIDDRSKRIDEL